MTPTEHEKAKRADGRRHAPNWRKERKRPSIWRDWVAADVSPAEAYALWYGRRSEGDMWGLDLDAVAEDRALWYPWCAWKFPDTWYIVAKRGSSPQSMKFHRNVVRSFLFHRSVADAELVNITRCGWVVISVHKSPADVAH